MRNARLDESQAEIKIAGKNINNLRYIDDTILMAGNEEQLKSLLMKVKVKLLSRVQLSDPMDCSLPGSSINGVFQARVLDWGAFAFSVYAEYIMPKPGWKKHKLDSRLPGEISITSDMQMTPPLWQKVKRN